MYVYNVDIVVALLLTNSPIIEYFIFRTIFIIIKQQYFCDCYLK